MKNSGTGRRVRGIMGQSPDTKELQARLGMPRGGRARRFGRWIVALLVLAAIVAGALRLRASRATPPEQYRTEAVDSGTLTVSVTATGELKALTQVNIGTEISGVVESVAVDYNSPVRVGQILARVNTEKLEAQAAQARAGLQSAEAKRQQSQATLAEAQAELAKLQHVRELSGGRVPSRQELDSQEASVKRAQADEASTGAQVAQSQASLRSQSDLLAKTTQYSPIHGVIANLPILPQEIVLAIWLIAKGVNPSAVASLSASITPHP